MDREENEELSLRSVALENAQSILRARRQAEEELVKAKEALEQRTIELAAVNRELESFAYSVSHDLRAPLRAIDGFSLAVLEDNADKLDAEAIGHLTRVRKASQRMSQLIEDLLTLSRVSRGEIKKENIDLSATAIEIVNDLRESEPANSVDVEIQPGMRADGDGRLLRIALENLLSNAWKFTSKSEDASIAFGKDIKTGEFYVKDNGAGFDMEYADHLFAPFQRLHQSSEFDGTGIGLATVQRIIHRHHGKIRGEGIRGEGASFYFTID